MKKQKPASLARGKRVGSAPSAGATAAGPYESSERSGSTGQKGKAGGGNLDGGVMLHQAGVGRSASPFGATSPVRGDPLGSRAGEELSPSPVGTTALGASPMQHHHINPHFRGGSSPPLEGELAPIELNGIHLHEEEGHGPSTAPPSAISVHRTPLQPTSAGGSQHYYHHQQQQQPADLPPPPSKPPLMRDVLSSQGGGPSALPPLAPTAIFVPPIPAPAADHPSGGLPRETDPNDMLEQADAPSPVNRGGLANLFSRSYLRSTSSRWGQNAKRDALEQMEGDGLEEMRSNNAMIPAATPPNNKKNGKSGSEFMDECAGGNDPQGDDCKGDGKLEEGGVCHRPEDGTERQDPEEVIATPVSGRLGFRIAILLLGFTIWAGQCGSYVGFGAISAAVILPTRGYGPMLQRVTLPINTKGAAAPRATIYEGEPVYQNGYDGTVTVWPLPGAELLYLNRPTPSTTDNDVDWSSSLGTSILHSCAVLPSGDASGFAVWGLRTDLSTNQTKLARITTAFESDTILTEEEPIRGQRFRTQDTVLSRVLAATPTESSIEEVTPLGTPSFEGPVNLLGLATFSGKVGITTATTVDSVVFCVEWQRKVALLFCPLGSSSTSPSCGLLMLSTSLPASGPLLHNSTLTLQCQIVPTYTATGDSPGIHLAVSLHQRRLGGELSDLHDIAAREHFWVRSTSTSNSTDAVDYQSFIHEVISAAMDSQLLGIMAVDLGGRKTTGFGASTQVIDVTSTAAAAAASSTTTTVETTTTTTSTPSTTTSTTSGTDSSSTSISQLILSAEVLLVANATDFKLQVILTPLHTESSSSSAQSYIFTGSRSFTPCGTLITPAATTTTANARGETVLLVVDVLEVRGNLETGALHEVTMLVGQHATRLSLATSPTSTSSLQCLPLWSKSIRRGGGAGRNTTPLLTMVSTRTVAQLSSYSPHSTAASETAQRMALLTDREGQGQLWRMSYSKRDAGGNERLTQALFFLERVAGTFRVTESAQPAATSRLPSAPSAVGSPTVVVVAAFPSEIVFSCVERQSEESGEASSLCFVFDSVHASQVAFALENSISTAASMQNYLESRTRSATPMLTRLSVDFQWTLIGRAAATRRGQWYTSSGDTTGISLLANQVLLPTARKDPLSFELEMEGGELDVFLS